VDDLHVVLAGVSVGNLAGQDLVGDGRYVHVALDDRLEPRLVGAGEAHRLKEVAVGVEHVGVQVVVRERLDDLRGGHQVAGGGVGIHEGHGSALDILNGIDGVVGAVGDEHGVVDGLVGVSVLRLHHDGFQIGALHTQGQGLGAHVGHIGAAGAQGFDDGIVVAGLDLFHLAAQELAQILGQAVAGVGTLRRRFIGGVSDGKHAVLPAGVGALAAGGGCVSAAAGCAAAGQQGGRHGGGEGHGPEFFVEVHDVQAPFRVNLQLLSYICSKMERIVAGSMGTGLLSARPLVMPSRARRGNSSRCVPHSFNVAGCPERRRMPHTFSANSFGLETPRASSRGSGRERA